MNEINSQNDQMSPDFSFIYQHNNFSIEEEFLFSKYQQPQQHQNDLVSESGLLNDNDSLSFNISSPTLETCLEEIENAKKIGGNNVPILASGVNQEPEKGDQYLLKSLELLKIYGRVGSRQLKTDPIPSPVYLESQGKRLSMDEILRISSSRFIQTSSQGLEDGVTCATSHPFEASFAGFSREERKDIELVESLLASAEKVGYQQYERARKLLLQCENTCSSTGNPVERLVYYFREALMEKVDRETGRSFPFPKHKVFDTEEAMMRLTPTKHAFHETVPFSQLSLFAGIQAIVERVEEAEKIHVIDIGIRTGLPWTVLMQALTSSSSLKLLKITAIGTKHENLLRETGDRLSSFAQSLKIPFSFKLVMVPNMFDLKEEHFELEKDETVAIYASYTLRTMLPRPEELENIMRVLIIGLKPHVMVVTEVEASLNSPAFVTRFTEALFYFGAFFECLEAFMKGDEENRRVCESGYFGEGIKDIVVNEGGERKIRHVTVDIWRSFFGRFGLEDVKLSASSLYQCMLILDKFCCGDSCSLDMNGNSVIFRWKGTPIQSLSVWKFT